MSILESFIYGLLFGFVYKLLKIATEHKKTLNDIRIEVKALQENYWEMRAENEVDD